MMMPLPQEAPPRREPAFNMPPVIVVTLLVLALIHGVRKLLLGPQLDFVVVLAFGFIPQRVTGPIQFPLPDIPGASVWSFVTYAFLHADVVHLLVNSFWLAAFGTPLARRFGAGRFILFSLAGAVGGAAAHLVTHLGDPIPMVGASAAISAHMAAACRFIFINPRLGEPTIWELDPSRRRAASLAVTLTNPRVLTFLAVWFGVNIAFGLFAPGTGMVSGAIAWQAHVGGFLVGLLAFPLFDPVGRGGGASATPMAEPREPRDSDRA